MHQTPTLRQLVIDALQHEMELSPPNRRRMTSPPVKLAADAPLRTLSPDEIKRLDSETDMEAEAARQRALHR